MSESYTVEFYVKPDALPRFHELLGDVLNRMRHEATFCSSMLLEDPDDPAHLILLETWRDREDVLETQLRRGYREAWHAALADILARDRNVTVWRPLRGDAVRLEPNDPSNINV